MGERQPCPRARLAGLGELFALVHGALLLAAAPLAAQPSTLYVRCDGDRDTTELQAAIDAAGNPGSVPRLGRVVLSAGTCVVEQPLVIAAVRGLHIEGQGRFNTILRWTPIAAGPADSYDNSMFRLQRARETVLEGFAITVAASRRLEWAIDVQNACVDPGRCPSPTAGPPSHANVFRDLLITSGQGSLGSGIAVRLPDGEDDDNQNERHEFHNVEVVHHEGTGFLLEGVNSKANLFLGCHCDAFATRGRSCVTTLTWRRRPGAFSWYGGISLGHSDSDFVLDSPNDTTLISGLYSEKSRMLLRLEGGQWEQPLTIEAVTFRSERIHEAGDNPDGLVVWLKGLGPFSMRGNALGSKAALGEGEAPDLSICYEGTAETPERPGGGFVFEGNAIATARENPFAPRPDCRYPTTQASNIVYAKDFPGGAWSPMPVNATELVVPPSGEFSVRRLGTSRELFRVSGAHALHTLQGGIVGQELRLIGLERAGTTICDASQPCAGPRANIHLVRGINNRLRKGETLTLTMFEPDHWHEVARSEHMWGTPR